MKYLPCTNVYVCVGGRGGGGRGDLVHINLILTYTLYKPVCVGVALVHIYVHCKNLYVRGVLYPNLYRPIHCMCVWGCLSVSDV